jgi:AcrR family transcriptional regulator
LRVYHPKNRDHIEECQRQLEGYQLAIEFRNKTRFEGKHAAVTLAFERERNLVNVIVDEPQGGEHDPVWEVTNPALAILRLHGRNHETWNKKGLTSSAERFSYDYNDDELAELVISAAGVSRGTFYKYFPSPDALVRELAIEIANELIGMAEPIVLSHADPPERVSSGMRLASRLAIDHPLAANFLVRLGWPDARGPNMLLDYVKRDLMEGIRQGRFTRMPIALALNIVTGAVLGATHCMLEPGCESDFAEQSAAAALRGLGLDAKSAERIANSPLRAVAVLSEGLLSGTAETLAPAVAKPTRPGAGRRKLG